MRIQITPNSEDKIQLLRPAHVYFEHVDLEKFEAFAVDFGFKEVARAEGKVYYGGYGRDPYVYVASKARDGKPAFRGAAFVAASKEDFRKAAALPDATITDLVDTPGGGSLVSISRPNGTQFHVVYGQQEREIDTATARAPSAVMVDQGDYNYPFHKPRLGK